MTLTDTQKAEVAKWLQQGAKISEIQTRLGSELGVRLTYMEVRFLVDDLKLTPVDPEPPKAPEPPPAAPAANANANAPIAPTAAPAPEQAMPLGGSVSVTVDQIARPGALVSGKVTFSDGQKAAWTLDQMGRLGLAADQKGYRPKAADVEQFQLALQNELAKAGF
jgi:hypothetical protein